MRDLTHHAAQLLTCQRLLDYRSHMNQRITLHISGRVQGVGFRMSAAQEATDLGLSGYVRNLDSGDVELVAEGDPDALAEIIAWCHHGPPLARVQQVHNTRSPATGEFMGFSLGY